MANTMANVIRVFTTFGPVLTSIIAGIALLIPVVVGLGIAFQLMGKSAIKAWAATLAPILPIIGAIAGITAGLVFLLFVIEDIAAFFQGKNSIFGNLVKEFEELGPVGQYEHPVPTRGLLGCDVGEDDGLARACGEC